MNAELKLEWAQRLINVVCGEPYGDGMTVTDVGMGYAEPGYHDNVTTWVLGSWWDRKRLDSNGIQYNDTRPSRLFDALERLGIEGEWYDEWTKCSSCNRIVRTSGDSYMWKPFYVDFEDGDRFCGECVKDDSILPDAIAMFVNNPNTRITFLDASDLESQGWQRYNAQPYQSGWHPGMDADPQKVYDEIHAADPNVDVLFFKDEASQFYSEWSAFTKKPEPEDDDTYVGYATGEYGE